MAITRRTFLAALAAIPLAQMLPTFATSPEGVAGGPFKFRIEFPDGTAFIFNGYVCDKDGNHLDLTQLSGQQEVFIRPEGMTEFVAPTDPTPSEDEDDSDDDTEEDYEPEGEMGAPATIARGPSLVVNGVEIAEIGDISLPSWNPPSYRDFAVGGLRRRGEMTFQLNFDPEV